MSLWPPRDVTPSSAPSYSFFLSLIFFLNLLTCGRFARAPSAYYSRFLTAGKRRKRRTSLSLFLSFSLSLSLSFFPKGRWLTVALLRIMYVLAYILTRIANTTGRIYDRRVRRTRIVDRRHPLTKTPPLPLLSCRYFLRCSCL